MFKGLQGILRCKSTGLIHCGPPCSSFVWLNRGTSKRNAENPEGDPNVESVQSANTIFVKNSGIEL